MYKCYNVIDGKIAKCETGDGPLHVFVKPEDAERKRLIEEFKIDPHTLLSALDPDETARLEREGPNTAIILKVPKNYSAADNFVFKVASMGLFLSKHRLVIVLNDDLPFLVGKFAFSLDTLHEIVLNVVSSSIYRFLEHLKVINMLSEAIEKRINVSMENKQLLNLFSLEKSLVYYLNAVSSNGFLLDRLRHNASEIGLDAKNAKYLDDIAIENNQCYKQAEIYSNILAGLMDARAGIVGNNLNLLMKTLNLITIGIMFPTLVVSIFSMNVNIPLAQNPYAFWIIMGLAAVSVGSFIYFWKRNRW